MKYDYCIVGAGLYGATFAHFMQKAGKKCLVLEKRNHIGGNCYTEKNDDIEVHTYGPHIFHTSNRKVWEFINAFDEFTPFINRPLACYKGKMYNLPFNMNTFHRIWGVCTPEEAKAYLAADPSRKEINDPTNLEEQAIKLVGRELYEILIKGYTEKQWGCSCRDLPAFIIKRLPLRFTYDNNYFTDTYQGIPTMGYTRLIEKLLAGCEVQVSTDFFEKKEEYLGQCKRILFTGRIDEYYGQRFGSLEYRSLRFETEKIRMPDFQGNAVVNYTDRDVPFTRIVEHKHFQQSDTHHTIITREYPKAWQLGDIPYYPINNLENDAIYRKYAALADTEDRIIFGGRLGLYRYLNMDKVIEEAWALASKEIEGETGCSI